MVRTPWGLSDELRARKLTPGRGVPPAEVKRSQRERLFGAMVACVAEKGYEQTSVTDLLAVSGVSRRTFYQLFADKQACFVATVEAIVAAAMAVAGSTYAGERPWQEEGGRTLQTVFEMCAEQPAAARLLTVDAHAVGAAGLEPIFEAVESLEALALAIRAPDPQRRKSQAALVRAVTGGLHRVMYERLSAGREAELPGCAAEAWAWAVSYSPLPGPLRSRRRRPVAAAGAPPFAAHIPSERILRGFAAAVAERGYAATTIADIAAAARISQATFYAHFAGKEDAMAAALDTSGSQMVAATLPAVRRAASWPAGVRTAVSSMFAFLAAEPAFARLRALEAFTAGPEAVAARDRATAEVLEVTLALDEAAPRLPGLAAEATIGALNGVMFDAVRTGGAEALLAAVPVGTYVVLAPMMGAKRAYAVCCE